MAWGGPAGCLSLVRGQAGTRKQARKMEAFQSQEFRIDLVLNTSIPPLAPCHLPLCSVTAVPGELPHTQQWSQDPCWEAVVRCDLPLLPGLQGFFSDLPAWQNGTGIPHWNSTLCLCDAKRTHSGWQRPNSAHLTEPKNSTLG